MPDRTALRGALVAPGLLLMAACAQDLGHDAPYRTTLQGLALEDARRCDSGFEYPSSLVEGISQQLVEELVCMDPDRLQFYESCREPGCITADGPQPWAMRPELIVALEALATATEDNISITAGYRDVAMQYYSRWYQENCNEDFNAAVPGESNHQGGRAIDVRYYDYWWDALLEVGFNHPIPSDEPHFEWVGDEVYRAESAELRAMSVEAFQRLWNRNHPEDTLRVDGVYGAATKARLGASPVEGFPIGACAGGGDEPDAGLDVVADVAPDDVTPDDATPVDATPDDATPEDTTPNDVTPNDATPDDVPPSPTWSRTRLTSHPTRQLRWTPRSLRTCPRDASAEADAGDRAPVPRPEPDAEGSDARKRSGKSRGCAVGETGPRGGRATLAGLMLAALWRRRRT